jgi:hypothetical protein
MGKGSGQDARPGLSLESESSTTSTVSNHVMEPEGRRALSLLGDDFSIKEKDGYRLITPRKSKFRWERDERPYRSLILDPDDKIVSAGFPKFGNSGEPEFEDHDQIFREQLENGKVWFGEKLDGSLAIRSVIDGKVVFRTRGSFDGGPFGPAMSKVAEDKYSLLLDPTVAPDRSLLFEFVSPRSEFRVILHYPEDDLVYLGSVDHETLGLSDLEELQADAEKLKLRAVETVEVPHDVDDLLGSWERREGVVARCAGGQVLVKAKSQSYLALHRLRSHLTPKRIRQQLDEQNETISSVADWAKYLEDHGGDWELVQDTQSFVQAYFQTKQEAEREFAKLYPSSREALERLDDRKRYALEWALKLPRHQQPVAFLIADDRQDKALEKLETALLDQTFEKLNDQALLEEA